jgi:hypothetical protein
MRLAQDNIASIKLIYAVRHCISFAMITGALIALLTPVGFVSAAIPIPAVERIPYTDGSPETRSIPFLAWPDDLSEEGYVEEEFLLSGTANIYDYAVPDGPSAEPTIVKPDNPYITRMLIRRPADSEPFNGTIVLEILNATAKYDGAPMWDTLHDSLINKGAAWVGITYDNAPAKFMRDQWGSQNFPAPPNAHPRNNSRYATLNVRSWELTWDILMQTAALLKSNSATNPFSLQSVEVIIPAGYSQSAALILPLANSFHEIAMLDGQHLFDGYFFGDGGGTGRLLRIGPGGQRSLPPGDVRNLFAVDAPTIRFSTEPSDENKPDDPYKVPGAFPLVRSYEMAGGAHVDKELFDIGSKNSVINFGVPANAIDCGLPLNPLSISDIMSAEVDTLEQWIRFGTLPPDSNFVDLDGDLKVSRDGNGNALGGVRHPNIDVPLGTYLGDNIYPEGVNPFDPSTWGDWTPIFCPLFGAFSAFDQTKFKQLFGSKNRYLSMLESAVSSAIAQRILLPEDGAQIIATAKATVMEQDSNSSGSSALDLSTLAGLILVALLAAWRRKYIKEH